MIKGVTEKDLIITLISGGGSSLFCLPNNISVETLIEITKNLTQKGANIFELNTVRKHLSGVQGGQLAELCYPAKVISLIFSDVLGDDISMIASGPTVTDKTTVAEATQILSKYDLLDFYLPSGKELKETPKDPKYFENVKNILVVSNKNALEAMKNKAEGLGFETSVESQIISGYANQVGKEMVSKKATPKSCLLFGGETTVKISGNGVGGRNQEMALAALSEVQPNSILVCAASDGWDNTDHAGAIADTELFQKAKKLGVSPKEYLENSDSYNFFKKVGGAIYTGKLGSNVSDLYIMLYK
jgi:glycerate-2-kinase